MAVLIPLSYACLVEASTSVWVCVQDVINNTVK